MNEFKIICMLFIYLIILYYFTNYCYHYLNGLSIDIIFTFYIGLLSLYIYRLYILFFFYKQIIFTDL